MSLSRAGGFGGRQEGRQEGRSAVLLRLLERRFGVLAVWARQRIAAADSAPLENWGLHLLAPHAMMKLA